MRLLGKLISEGIPSRPFYHHLCYAHALHLAVQETLARGRVPVCQTSPDGEYSTLIGIFDSSGAFTEGDASDSEEDGDSPSEPCEDPAEEQPGDEPDHSSPIETIRGICEEFKKSRKKASLAKVCPLCVCLDTPIRWNSTLTMLERFVEVEVYIMEIYEADGEEYPLRGAT